MRSVLGWMGLLAFTFFSASPAIAKSRHRILELGPEQEAARLARGAIERPEIKTTIFPFELKKVAFGSCNFQRKAQNYFGQILGQKPDLWIWAGDIAYTDGLRRNARRHEYRIVKEAPEYARLYKQVPVIGVWDDHDFAGNNLGGWFSQKAVSQRTVLDFLDGQVILPTRMD
jgi:phosphodiesterase/alkaline phosphatase D-like protein